MIYKIEVSGNDGIFQRASGGTEQILSMTGQGEDQKIVEPIYKTFKGWKSSTNGIKKFEKLPKEAKIYISELEKFIETKVSCISTSPDRNDTILIENPFKI